MLARLCCCACRRLLNRLLGTTTAVQAQSALSHPLWHAGRTGCAICRRFLNRLLGVTVARQGLLFSYFAATLAAEIQAAKAEGRYFEGLSDLSGSAIERSHPKPEVSIDISFRSTAGITGDRPSESAHMGQQCCPCVHSVPWLPGRLQLRYRLTSLGFCSAPACDIARAATVHAVQAGLGAH